MKRFWLLLVMMASCMLSFAQDDARKKFSVSTQMFLDEMDGKISLTNTDVPTRRQAPGQTGQVTNKPRGKNHGRFIAAPDTIDGKVFISAFIHMDDNTDISALEALGVEVQCKFQNGLVTANIPVDKINDVADISKVKRINVARLRRPLTDKARTASNVDDALTLSTDAISAGLQSKYDGTGVVLGVIDTGIDFQHIAFKDADGNSRIKRAYVYNGRSASEYTSISSSSPTTDDSSEDHGTHTSSTAGGSSVIISGSNVTVTNDHSKATYGGMAPGADLYLAGINGLSETYLANAFQKICDYADSQNQPVVVSNSWGASLGPRDGTGDIADICAQYFNDNNPNHICLFAASNDAGSDGFHVSGTASSSSPLGTVIKWNSDYVSYYYGIIADAWPRSTDCTLACKLIVINKSSGSVATTINVSPSSNGATVSGLSNYFNGSLYAYKNYIESDKSEIMLYANGLSSNSYYLAVQFYPTSGSTVVDVWNGGYCVFSDSPSSSGYTWTDGSDDMCVSDEATIPDAISIGAYVTKNSVTDYNGSSHSLSSYYPTVGDIAYFSSYATADQSPTGLQYPWICAPGATIVSAVNHYDSSGDYSYINGNSAKYGMYRVNSNTTYPYGSMEGTSMATPAAAGIVALWLQAATEVGKELSTSDVKEIMKNTAINDSYTTTGSNASHFGNGKIDALAGIKEILGEAGPRIVADPTTVTFEGSTGNTYTETITVTGTNLTDEITVTLNDESGAYSVSPTTITATEAAAGKEVTITYKPTAGGDTSATLTLSSTDASDVTVTISGTAQGPSITASNTTVNFTGYTTQQYTQTVTVKGENLGEDIAVTVSGDASFTVDPTIIAQTDGAASADITIIWKPTVAGTQSGTITLSSEGAEDVVINLTGTAEAAVPTITASESSLTFSATKRTSETQTFNVSGMFLSGDVTITVEGTEFAVDPTTITVDEVLAEGGKDITVTFTAPSTTGEYSGTITLSSEGAEDVIINLTGTSTPKQTSKTVYKLVNSVTSGSDYLIVSSIVVGEANALASSENYSVSNATVTIQSETTSDGSTITFIENPNDYAVWTAGTTAGTNGSSYTFANNGYYLYHSGGALSISNETSKNNWTIGENTLSYNGGGTNRYLAYSNGWTLSTSTANVYFYEKTTIEIAEEDPVITADSTTLTFETTYVGTPTTTTFTVTGTDLLEDITVTLTDENQVFTVEPTTISTTEAEEGKVVTVTFTPTVAGTFTGTITLSSTDAENVEVSLSATAKLIGDVNRDGSVTIADVTAIVNIILGKATEGDDNNYDFDAADVNTDGSITIADVTALVNSILSKTE
ncbi:MAG: S8 family serine peptidase [Prevotella sp.]|nr:S8 family serine peptidase [Prevotella sp.]